MNAPRRTREAELMRAVFEGLGTGVCAADAEGCIIAANPRAEQITAYPEEQVLGCDLHELLHRREDGAAIPRSRCRVLGVLAGGRPTEGSDEFLQRGDGSLVPVTWAATPLRLPGRPDGVLVAFYDFSVRKAAEERTQAHVAALQTLTARLSLVAEISTVLGSTLEVPQVLRRLTHLLVPELADWAAVDLYTGEPGEVERIAVHARDDHGTARALEGPLSRLPESSGSALVRVLRDGRPVLLDAGDLVREPDSPLALAHRRLFEQLGGHSAAVVPLHTRRQVLGALTVARTGGSPTYTDADLVVLSDIGRRAGLVVDNARLFDRQRHVAEAMQRQLLTPLPKVDHLRMAARYRPAQETSEVGGDWYDAFLLADGVTTMIIGDVVGHDLRAAAHMAEVRNMLRALAWDRQEPPSLIMRRLDEAMTYTSGASMATAVFARVEGEEGGPWRLHWVNAGHPPPLLVTREGRTRYLEAGHGPLLGMSAAMQLGLHWPDAVEDLPPQSTVVFYTDGLVESRSRPIDTGMARLRRYAAGLARHDVEEFCDVLLDRIDTSGDDAALLVLRLPEAGAGAD